MKIVLSHLIPFSLLLVGLGDEVTGQAADPGVGIVVRGGIADPETKRVYLSSPAPGVVAVDIDSGKVLWESKDATRPAASLGKHVYGLAPVAGKANAFRVVTLDAADKGKVVKTSDAATLPEWVDVGDANNRLIGPRTFFTDSELDQGILRVRWSAFSMATAFNRTGQASVDLATGKVTTGPAKQWEPQEPKHSDEVLRVIRKRHWGVGESAVVVGGRVFGGFGGEKNGAWVLSVEVADLKTGEQLWTRVYQEVRPAKE